MSTRRFVLHWCVITLCTLLSVGIIVLSVLCLCSPGAMARFSGSMGMSKLETYFYSIDYSKTGNINSLYRVVLNSYSAKNYDDVVIYYELLENHERYDEFIGHINKNNMDSDNSNLNKSVLINEDNYLKNRYVLSLIETGEVNKAFNYAVKHFENYTNYTSVEQGTYLFYYLVDLDDADIFAKFNQKYNFQDTLYNEVLNYLDFAIADFYEIFDQDEFIENVDGVYILALNNRINQVFGDIKTVSEALGLEVSDVLADKVARINQMAVEYL